MPWLAGHPAAADAVSVLCLPRYGEGVKSFKAYRAEKALDWIEPSWRTK